jgi:hypothetical protein
MDLDRLDLPVQSRLAALIHFHDGMARSSRVTEAECLETDLSEAARRNRARAAAYRETAELLQALLLAAYPVPAEFRGHLETKAKPRAEIRAPP